MAPWSRSSWAGVCVLLCCVASTSGAWAPAAAAIAGSQEAFIGWRGETYLPSKAAAGVAAAAAAAAAAAGRGEQPAARSADTPAAAAYGTVGSPADTADVDQLGDLAGAAAAAAVQAPTKEPSYEDTEEASPPAAASSAAASQLHSIDVSKTDSAASWVQHLSWHPRLHLHHNFLTPAECDAMRVLLARPSHTVGGASSAAEEAALQLMLNVERRVANWTTLPPTHLEGWQLQQGFTASDGVLHTDLLTERFATEDYQRTRSATVMLFLGDGSEGGQGQGGSGSGNWSIVFPVARGGAWRGSASPQEYGSILGPGKQVEERLRKSRVGRRGSTGEVLKLHINTPESLGSSSSDGQGFCDGSVQAGLSLSGFKKGDALLVWNQLTDYSTPDASAAHLFCVKGNRQAAQPWIATTWMHNLPYGQDNIMALAASCQDNNPACRAWAQQGFCDDAPGIMLGLRGMCRYSCQDCRSCDHLQPRRAQASTGAAGGAPAPGASGAQQPSVRDYMECLYANMHSLRAEWSEAAREAGVRKARNAIRRTLRQQAANGFLSAVPAPGLQQSTWIH